MREFEYGLHCIRKHCWGIVEWLVEVIEKISTVYYKLHDNKDIKEEAKRELLKYIEDLSWYRLSLKAIIEDLHKKQHEIGYDEAIENCTLLIGLLREIRVTLDEISLELIERAVEDAVYDEIREIIGNCVAIIHHIVDTIENVVKKKEEEMKSKSS